jgi:magnesium transporter
MKTEFLKKEEHGLTWIDLHAPTEEELTEAALLYQLPLALVNECLDGGALPKYEEESSTKFLLLRSFHGLDSGTDVDSLTNRIAIFITEDFFVTLHRTGWDQILKVRDAVFSEIRKDNARLVAMTLKQQEQQPETQLQKQPRRNPHFKQIMFSEKLQSDIIFFTVKEVLESFERPLDLFEEKFEICEERIFSQESERSIFAESYTLKRQLFACHRALRMNLEVTRKLDSLLMRHSKSIDFLRSDAERCLGLIDSEIDNLHNLMTLQMSLQSNHTNEIMRVLAIFSAFFMPLTFIAGVYGMNFKFMPELEHPLGYAGALVLMLGVSGLIFWYFKKKKWIGSENELATANAETQNRFAKKTPVKAQDHSLGASENHTRSQNRGAA